MCSDIRFPPATSWAPCSFPSTGLPCRNPPGPGSTAPQYLVSFATAFVAIGGGEAIPVSHKEPVSGVHWPFASCCRPQALRTPRDLPGVPSGVRSCPRHRRCHLLTGLTLPGRGAEYGKAKPGEQPGCSRGGSGETRKPCCSSHPCCMVTRFLGKCRRCLAALAVSAGSTSCSCLLCACSADRSAGHQSESRWLPLEISR